MFLVVTKPFVLLSSYKSYDIDVASLYESGLSSSIFNAEQNSGFPLAVSLNLSLLSSCKELLSIIF